MCATRPTHQNCRCPLRRSRIRIKAPVPVSKAGNATSPDPELVVDVRPVRLPPYGFSGAGGCSRELSGCTDSLPHCELLGYELRIEMTFLT
jgi:hypothetical protein